MIESAADGADPGFDGAAIIVSSGAAITVSSGVAIIVAAAASLVVFGGELFVGTLPSARVHAMRAGAVASNDRSLGAGWHHLAGVRRGGEVSLYVDGALVASQGGADLAGDAGIQGSIAPRTGVPLVIGGGPRAGFEGAVADVRLWARALDDGEVNGLAG